MSKLSERTAIGGQKRVFETTRWSQISLVQKSDAEMQRSITNDLICAYWKPVYCYLRQKGYDNEEAKDLTHGFFQEIVLGRGLIQQADPSKGRFRTLLLTALNRYVSNEHRRETTRRRMPAHGLQRFDPDQLPDLPVEGSVATPDEAFNYAWATEILDAVLREVRKHFCDTGRTVYWMVFQERVLSPILGDVAPPSIPEICKKHGVDTESRASNMIATAKRRFQRVLEMKLSQFVEAESTVEVEMHDLLTALSVGHLA
jgi:hypothetical protein